MPKKIVIVNLASPANPGDQAIFLGTLELLKTHFPGVAITVSTRAYSERESYERLGCRVVPTYPNPEPLATDSLSGKLGGLARAFSGGALLREAIRQADLICFAGGAYLYSNKAVMPGIHFMAHLVPLHWAASCGVPVVLLPHSYGPFRSLAAKALFRGALPKASRIFFRERISGEWLWRHFPKLRDKMAFMPDLALYLRRETILPGLPRQDSMRRCLGVTVRPWKEGGKEEGRYIRELARALIWFQQEYDFRIRVIVQVQDPKKGEGDERVSRILEKRLLEQCKTEKIEYFTQRPFFTLPEICKLYDECDFLVGMRLHSTLLSLLMGRPALVTGYQHKAQGIYEALGLKELYLGSFRDIQAEALKMELTKVLTGYEVWKGKMETALSRSREEIAFIFGEKMRGVLR